MFDYIKKNKIYAAGVLVAVFAIFYYAFFAGGSAPAPAVTSTSASTPVSQKLVVMLTSLNTIELNSAVFKDPVFQSLADFGVVIPQQQVGRRNPFAPLQNAVAPSGQKLPTSNQNTPAK